MTEPSENQRIAIKLVEDQLVGAKREAAEYERRGQSVPEYVTRKIMNLKGAAVALRKAPVGEVK